MSQRTCPQCGREMKFREGFSKKTGEKYAFWGCTGYPACEYTIDSQKAKTVPSKPVSVNQGFGNALKDIDENQKRIIRGLTKVLTLLNKEKPKTTREMIMEKRDGPSAPMPEEEIPVIEEDLPF